MNLRGRVFNIFILQTDRYIGPSILSAGFLTFRILDNIRFFTDILVCLSTAQFVAYQIHLD